MSLTVHLYNNSMVSFERMAQACVEHMGIGEVVYGSLGVPVGSSMLVMEGDHPHFAEIARTTSLDGVEGRVALYGGNVEEVGHVTSCSFLTAVMDYDFQLVAHSPHHMSSILSLVRERLSPGVAEGLEGRLHYIPYGVSEDFQYRKGDRGEVVVPYTRIVKQQKNLALHISCCSKLRAWGGVRGIRFRFPMHCDPNFSNAGFQGDASLYDMRPLLKGAEYVEACQRAGMFLSTSNFESFGIMYLELLCSGAVGVFLDRPWVRKLLPNYPYVVSKGKLVPMMIWVHQNHDEASARIRDEVIPYIRRTYSLSLFHDALSRLLLP